MGSWKSLRSFLKWKLYLVIRSEPPWGKKWSVLSLPVSCQSSCGICRQRPEMTNLWSPLCLRMVQNNRRYIVDQGRRPYTRTYNIGTHGITVTLINDKQTSAVDAGDSGQRNQTSSMIISSSRQCGSTFTQIKYFFVIGASSTLWWQSKFHRSWRSEPFLWTWFNFNLSIDK